MTNNQKLKAIIAVLFAFMVILVGILVYTTKVYDTDKEKTASNTSVSTGSADEKPSSAASASAQAGDTSTGQSKETIDLKLYNYDAEDYENPKEIVNVSVEKQLYQKDITAAVNKVLETTGLSINKAELKDDLITVDLTKDIAAKFNKGSAGGITYTNILAMTILNLPGVNKLKVTIEGVPDMESDHFSFNGTFIKTANGNKYELSK